MNKTTTAILRERISKLNGAEFCTDDLLYHDPLVPDHDAFIRAAVPALGKLAYGTNNEIEIVRKERGNKSGFKNIYKEKNLKIVYPRFKSMQEDKNKPKILPTTIEVWSRVWPDMFRLPKFVKKTVFKTNHCLG